MFKIMGGQDKQGFPMKQGVLVPGRVQILMSPGDSCFRGFGRRNGERRRKSVRGCIVSPDLSVLNLVIVKKGAPHRLQCLNSHVTWALSVYALVCSIPRQCLSESQVSSKSACSRVAAQG